MGKSDLVEYLAKQTEDSVEKISLQEGSILLQPKWGLSSLLNWMKLKFQIDVPESSLPNQTPTEVEKILVGISPKNNIGASPRHVCRNG